MASMLKRTMLYLGLAPDEEYDSAYDDPGPDPEVRIVNRPTAPSQPDVVNRTVRAVPITASSGITTLAARRAGAGLRVTPRHWQG